MARLVDAVRNSPLLKRHAGGYSVLESETKDPFVNGVHFHAHFVGSGEVPTKQDSPEVQAKVKEIWDEGTKKKSLCKVVITIRSNSVSVKAPSTKFEDNYPIYLVSYCGASTQVDLAFYFIHKTKLDRLLRVEVFKLASKEKVSALTLTLAKAFNIAFKAWIAERRNKDKEKHRTNGTSSPDALPKDRAHLARMAPGVATKSSGPFTPPAPRKTGDVAKTRRRGSFGDEPDGTIGNPPVVRKLQTSSEATGSVHNVTITEDYDKGFQELVDAPHSPTPEVLPTSLGETADAFSLEAIQQHIDKPED